MDEKINPYILGRITINLCAILEQIHRIFGPSFSNRTFENRVLQVTLNNSSCVKARFSEKTNRGEDYILKWRGAAMPRSTKGPRGRSRPVRGGTFITESKSSRAGENAGPRRRRYFRDSNVLFYCRRPVAQECLWTLARWLVAKWAPACTRKNWFLTIIMDIPPNRLTGYFVVLGISNWTENNCWGIIVLWTIKYTVSMYQMLQLIGVIHNKEKYNFILLWLKLLV